MSEPLNTTGHPNATGLPQAPRVVKTSSRLESGTGYCHVEAVRPDHHASHEVGSTAAPQSDLAMAHRFTREFPAVSALMVVVMQAACVASIQGWLRWDHAYMLWSFAALAQVAVFYFAWRTWQGWKDWKG